jgi:hypothetical protein
MSEHGEFREWALVEVMGHQRFAGEVSEQQIAGAAFVRVDVPEWNGRQGFTRLFSPGAIYAITPCSEQTAKRAIDGCTPHPFTLYDFEVHRPELECPDAVSCLGDDEEF